MVYFAIDKYIWQETEAKVKLASINVGRRNRETGNPSFPTADSLPIVDGQIVV